jgi:hypothetical protein
MSTRAREWLSTIVSVLGVLGAIIYGLLRLSYEAFYAEFGVSPEDVGVNATEVLSQAALGLIVVLITGVIYLVLLLLSLSFLFAVVVAAWFVGRTLIALPGVIFRGKPMPDTEGALHEGFERAGDILEAVLKWLNGHRRFTGILFGVLTIGTTLSLYAFEPDNAARCAMHPDGPAVSSLHTERVRATLLGVRAEPSTVTWLDSTPPEGFKTTERMVYLGDNEGSRVLYRPQSKQTVRIPQGDITLATYPDYPEYDLYDSCDELQMKAADFDRTQGVGKSAE